MNAEELKSLVEAVKAVSGDTRAVLLWYFALGVLRELLWFAFWVVTTPRLLGPIYRLFSNGHISGKIAGHLGVDSGHDRSQRDNDAIHRWVDLAIERDRSGKKS